MRRSQRRSTDSRTNRSSTSSRGESFRRRLGSSADARDAVRKMFVGLFAFVVLAIVLSLITALVRLVFTFGWGFVVNGIPAIAQMFWADPWLFLALAVAALLAWSRPWEDFQEPGDPPPRRGPRVERW
jgi:hypothetical protein